MTTVYAPGCALVIHKPHLAKRMLDVLQRELGDVAEHLTCCRHEPGFAGSTQVVNTCAGCDRRYRERYAGVTTKSMWEVLAHSKSFAFPDYQGREMAIHDACPTRSEERVHMAVRQLLERMNIKVIEPRNTRTSAVCCGDTYFGVLPVEQVKDQMKKRAQEMPCEEVVVYCVSCIKAMHIGGKQPRYLVDLLFGEQTEIGTFEPEQWHAELQRFIDTH